MKLCLIAALATGLLLAGGEDEAVTKEKKLLQGTWDLVALEVAGKKAARKEVEGMAQTFEFKGDALMITSGDIKKTSKGTYRVYPKMKPKCIDITESWEGKNKTGQCLYSLEGDTLTICVAEDGEPRPMKIESKPDPPLRVMTFKRKKP